MRVAKRAVRRRRSKHSISLIPPMPALWGLVSLPFSLAALGLLWVHRHQPTRLKPALALTVVATLLHGLGMAWGFAQMARFH